MAKKKSVFSELAQKRDGERRFTTLNASRWSFGWQIFRAHIGRIIVLNLFMLVSALGLILLFINRYGQLSLSMSSAPFSANLGFGYMPYTDLVGLPNAIVLSANMFFCIRLPLAGILFGAGLAGGLYVMRNMFWLEDIHVVRDFFKGIAKNWLVIVLTFAFTLVVSVCIMCISYSDYFAAVNGSSWHYTFTKIVCIIAIAVFALMFLNSITMTVTYKVGFFGLIKNSFLISVILCPIHVFMVGVALVPALLIMLGSLFRTIGIVFVLVFGLSYFVLVWTDYSHWIYERFLSGAEKASENKKSKSADAAKKTETKAKSPKNGTSEAVQTKDEESTDVISSIKPFTEDDPNVRDIPSVFTFSDILNVKESKENMRKDSDEYAAKMENASIKKQG